MLFSQTVLFQENFEGTVNMTSSSTGSGTWVVNTRLQSQGLKSDSATVTMGDTTYLAMTSSIDATGNPSLYLRFSHIAKVEFFDSCFVEASANGGATWTRLTSNEYLGSGYFANDYFSSATYAADWQASAPAAQPQNSWWKTELFNISAIAGDSANVKVRFVLVDGNNSGSGGNAGWFLDSISLMGAVGELTPPAISLVWPNHLDTLTQGADYHIKAAITDASGIDTAMIAYVTSTGFIDTVAMASIATDTFQGTIPFIGFGKIIDYQIIAVDNSPAANMTIDPAIGYHRIVAKYQPGMGIIAYQEGFENGFPSDWTQANYDNMNWTRNSGPTGSSGTGPSGAYEGSWYMYTETSGYSNKTAVIETPQFNLDTIYSPMVSFYYHMYGATMGDLHFEVLSNGAWVDLWTMSGEQQTANGDPWREAVVDVSAYQTDTTQFRFRGETGTSYTSDMCIDDFKVGGPVLLSNDIGVDQILNPTGGVMAGTAMPVQITFSNFGSDTITTATVGWSYDGAIQPPYAYTGSLVQGAQTPSITVGSPIPVLGTHTIKTWTENPNGTGDFNLGNDSMEVTFYACANLLSGTYTIDPSGSGATNYQSFADAALALNQCGINGAVTFNVASGVYNEQLHLLPVNGSSATNTITFQSAAGDSSLVSLKYNANTLADNYVVDLDGTSYITFKNMTFEAEDTIFSNVFVLENTVHNFAVENSVVKATVPSTANGNTMNLFSTVGDLGSFISIQHNMLINSAYAVNLEGAPGSTNWLVNDNTIHGQYAEAIHLKNALSAIVTNNDIKADTSSTYSGYEGIYLLSNTGSALISKNKIYNQAIATGYGIRVTSCLFDSLNPATIANNFVDMHVNSSGTTISAGILNHESRFVNVFYNTVRMTGAQLNSPAMCLFDGTAGLSRGVTIVNNIFANNAMGYIYYVNNVDTSLWVDQNNDLFNYNATNGFAYLGSAVSNYNTWLTESGTMNSANVDPYFASATDLHVSNNLLNNLGTPIAGITDDIDGVVRNTTTPDMGAAEFDASPNDIYAIDFLSPMGDCGLTNAETVIVRYKNIGSASITSFSAEYQVMGSATVVTEAVSSTILPGDTFSYAFNTTVDLDIYATGADSTFELSAWGTLTGDSDHTNDTTFTEVLSGYVPDTIHVDNDTILYQGSDTLYASGMSPYWWASDTASTELVNDTMFVTGPLYDTTTFWVSDRAGSGLFDAQIGNGTATNSANGYPSPYTNWYWGSKDQYLFLASELTAMGISAGPIEGIQFDVAAVNSVPTLNNYEISIGSTTASAMTTWISGLTVVFSPGSYTASNGWNSHPFSTPFIWDGVSNIVVQVCSNNSSYVSSGNASVNSTVTPFNSVLNYHMDATGICQNASMSYGFPGTQRPNVKLTINGQGCFSDRTPVTVVVTGFPQYDASLEPALIEPTGSVPSGVNTAIKAVLKNFGQVTMTSVKIPYSINGTIEDTITWTGNLPYNTVDTIVIDSVNFKGGVYNVTAYTMLPNGVTDTINTNDTATTNFVACLNGTYTIGDTITGNADFGSFSGAVFALNGAGVCGDVVFNVETGTYSEQFTLEEIVGAGPNSTITFQSANGDSTSVILIDTATANANNFVIKLDGADYFTFQNMTIKAGGTNYARLIEISNESEHNTFTNNVFEMPASTSSNASAFYSPGSNDNYLTITNNHIINGGYAFYLRGASTVSREKGLVLDGNFIDGFGYYGLYLYYSDSAMVTNNKIVSGQISGYSYAVYAAYLFDGFVVANNDIQMTKGASSSKYGLRMYFCNYYYYANGAAPGYVYNNMINIRAGSGTKYGLDSYYCDNVRFYYNTVYLSGIASNGRALNQYNSTSSTNGEIYINNNFIDSTGGYAAYFGTPAVVNSSDYNNFYSDGGDIAYWGGAKATLADLQTASGKDAHSLNVLPMFQGPNDLHVVSLNLSAKATPIALVTTDIDGELRDVNMPTIGADEVPLLPIDVGVYDFLNMPDTTVETLSVPVIVRVKNYGTDTVNAFAIDYTVNNGTPVTYAYMNSLAPNQLDTVTLTPMTSPAGSATICATTVLATDSNAFNDGICHNFFGIPNKDAYLTMIEDFDETCGMTTDTVVVWIKNIGVDTINAVGQSGQPTVNYIADLGTAATVVTENFNTLVLPGDSVSYTFTTLIDFTNSTQYDSVYNVAAWVAYPGDNVTYNDTAYTEVTSLHMPADPTFISPITVPYGTSIVLTASAVDTILWYYTDTASTEFHQGGSYTTPTMYNDDTLYLAAVAGGGVFKLTETVQFKTGTGYGSYPAYLPTGDFDGVEISNIAGGQGDLSGYEINVNTGSYTYTYVFPAGTQIAGGEVALAIYGSGLTIGPAGNNVFYINSSTAISSSSLVSYWLKDPAGNIVDAFASNGATFPITSGVTPADFSGTLMGGGGHVGAIRTISDNNMATDWIVGGNGVPASFGVANPQIPLQAGQGCSSNRVQMIIDVTGQPADDVSAHLLTSPVSMIYLSATELVTVRVKNYGTADQDTIPVAYVLDNNPPVIDTIFANVASNDSIDFTFSVPADLSVNGTTYAITVYTDLAGDVNHLNDTIHNNVTNLVPSYCACSATSTGYEELVGCSVGAWSTTNTATGAMYTDYTSVTPTALVAPGVTYTASITSDFAPGYTYAYTCYANMFIDFNRDGVFSANELAFGGTTNSSNTLTGTVSVPYNALPGMTFMRVVFREGGTASNTGPCGTYTWGETEDYKIMIMTPIPHDAGVETIINPQTVSNSNSATIDVRVRNYGTDTISSVDVSYILNGAAPVTMTYNTTAIAPMDSMDINLGNIALQDGANSICTYTTLPGDTNNFNDTLCMSTFTQATVTLAYNDDFEGQDLWMPDTLLNQWERGIPAMTNINTAHSPVNVWGIDLDGTYANNSGDYLYSPRIVTTGLDSAILKFWNYYDTQSNDGGAIQISIDDGPWITLGLQNDPMGTNWYNSSFGGNPWWSGNSNGWTESSYKMMLNNTTFNNPDTIQVRFYFKSNGSGNTSDGWAIDDFAVELVKIPQDGGVVAISSPAASVAVGSNVTVAIDVKNFGTDTLMSIPVSYTIGGTTENATFTVPAPGLLPDSVKTYTFATGFTAPNIDFSICAKTEMNDAYPQNDETCKQVQVTMAPIDVKAVGLMVDPAWHDTTKITFDNTVEVQVVNNGTTTLTSIALEYRVGSTVKSTGTWTGSLASLDTLTYTFVDTYKSPLGYYQVCAKATVTGDADNTNDEFCKNYFGINNIGIEENVGDVFSVEQNQPNPAHGKVLIDFTIPQSGKVHFELRNALGQIIVTEELDRQVGQNQIEVDAAGLASGVYYYTVEFDKHRITKKMLVNN